MVRFVLFFSIMLILSMICITNSLALEGPYYCYTEIETQCGARTDSGQADPGPYGNWTIEASECKGTTSLTSGSEWWTSGSTGIIINPGTCMGWSTANVDPATGTIGIRTGARNYGGPTEPYSIYVPWLGHDISYPPPSTWGYASCYAYMSRLVQVQSDGTLSTGDIVDIEANATINGEFQNENNADASSTSVDAVMFVSKLTEADFSTFNGGASYLDWSDVTSIYEMGMQESYLGCDRYTNYSTTSADVDGQMNVAAQAAVGDYLVVETMIKITAEVENSFNESGREAWSEFGDTLTSSLAANTPGALLTPYNLSQVPEPAGILAIMCGIVGLAGFARRRSA
ncbi:hypothetical protein LLG46_06495 [bacterium]|nr:hypothetical protein [bacterium]